MKLHLKKSCDICGKRGKSPDEIKRWNISRHFPYYLYEGFDLCEECQENFMKYIEDFFTKEGKNGKKKSI